ncbi:MAG: ATP phosphoribosyltransferase [Gammaproteobacteria bacterium]|nr:ATP phosphoribosyltransferase [Gammaproteobacteria bacterium]
MNDAPVKIALAKGRILDEALPLFERIGLAPVESPSKSRKLVIDTESGRAQLVIIRGADVPTYVQFGAAHLGIVGKDVLLEHGGGDLAELLDLGFARCRLVVAEPADLAGTDGPHQWQRLRIATKYPNIARRHFAARGVQTRIIKLYGSMELAPLVGLADRIVDLVDTGGTLKANRLEEVETVTEISARLIANLAALRMQAGPLNEIIQLIQNAVTPDER